jgi:hypothetical protein
LLPGTNPLLFGPRVLVVSNSGYRIAEDTPFSH